MAVVVPLRQRSAERLADPANVVRLAEALGPISPELVLVDPELASRARALLLEAPRHWRPPAPEHAPLNPAPGTDTPLPPRATRRVVAALALAAVPAVSFGLGWAASTSVSGDERFVQSRPPVAAPAPSTPPVEPTPSPVAPTRAESPTTASPRFVWPAEQGALGYRVSIFRDGRQIFERDVTATALEVPGAWTYKGRFQRLTRGTYRWVVWPLFGTGAKSAPGRPIVSARYTV